MGNVHDAEPTAAPYPPPEYWEAMRLGRFREAAAMLLSAPDMAEPDEQLNLNIETPARSASRTRARRTNTKALSGAHPADE